MTAHISPPPKKGASGCLVAPIIGGVVALAFVVVVVAVAVKVRNAFTPEERATLASELREGNAATTDPAAEALRQEGCGIAQVVDVSKMPALTKLLVDAGPKDTLREKVIVDCTPKVSLSAAREGDASSPGPFTYAAMSCERVAKVYVKFAGTRREPFRVMVHNLPNDPPICTELRSPDGTLL